MDGMIERIRAAMEAKGMRQADVCRATGISTALMSQIMTGRTKSPRLDIMMDIARSLDVDMNYICGWEDED